MKRRVFGVVGVLGLLAAFGAVPVSADGPGYHQPPAVQDNCNAGHGAFGAFSVPSEHFVPGNGQPPYFNDDTLGSARAGATGQVNSDYSAFCRTQ